MRITETTYRDDALHTYFKEIRRIPRLSLEEELALARLIRQGNGAAKEKLIKANLRLAVTIARQFSVEDVSFMDIVQEGNIGLMRAAETYDPERNTQFGTYAGWWIRQYISRFLMSKRRNIRLPYRKEQTLRNLTKVYQDLSQTLMRQPTIRELAEKLNIPAEEAARILNLTNGYVSLETDKETEETVGIIDLHEDYTYNPEREFFRRFAEDNTLRLLNRLKNRDKWILVHRYQLKNGKRYTLRQLGDKLNLSPETIRQIEKKALTEIRSCGEEFRETLYGEAM